MELWWNLDILWWNLDRFEHKFDGNITNWPCWSEGKLGTGPFTWLGQGFHTNFLEIPFQTGEKRHFDGLSIARKIGFMLTPVFCNASRNNIWILFDMQPGQTGVKPCPLDLQNHLQGLTNLLHLEKADDSERDVHSEEVAMVCPSNFVLVVPSRKSCKMRSSS